PVAPAAASSSGLAIGALIQQLDATPVGNAVTAPVFGEDRAPPGDPQNPKAVRLAMHGYFRAPLRIGWRERTAPKPDEAKNDIRTPWLVDDDYFRSGFLYNRNAESDWTEVYIMAGNQYVTATVAVEATLFSDWARPIIDKQLGLTKGWVTFHHAFDLPGNAKLRLQIKGGAFSDRYGWQEKYDTYIFGRTHQMGERIRADVDYGKLTFSVAHGFGARLEAIESNQGLALLSHLRLGVSYNRAIEASFYSLNSFTQDKRQLKEITDASVDVTGFEVRGDAGALGRAVVGISKVTAEKGSFIAPAIEVMHSAGGRGLEENYFGTEKSNKGTGSLLNLGFQYDINANPLLKKYAGTNMGQADVQLTLFGMYAKVTSDQKDADPQVNRDGRQLFKWGAEVAAWPLSFLGASLRYDRVIYDIVDDPSAFRVISPRVTLRTHWLGDALLFLQWSHYVYGERVLLRPGQVPLETKPDVDFVKIQAQMSF
ncbi:MAG TPA: hypothetical protein PK156_32210, partial [Polyangium sp.]|nr:hypothetical protein [Polyangium sp.]